MGMLEWLQVALPITRRCMQNNMRCHNMRVMFPDLAVAAAAAPLAPKRRRRHHTDLHSARAPGGRFPLGALARVHVHTQPHTPLVYEPPWMSRPILPPPQKTPRPIPPTQDKSKGGAAATDAKAGAGAAGNGMALLPPPNKPGK